MGFNTALLHQSAEGDVQTGATLTPIYQSSAFYQPSAEQHEKLFHNKANGFSYTRINNPTIVAFEQRMTALEKGIASVACASGMAALTNALLNIAGAGDEIIASTSLYGGTIDLFHDLETFGIHTIFVESSNLEQIEDSITEKTRVIFAETIGNPKLDVTDIPALADLAHRHGLPLIMDNTVATAYLVRPIEFGADVVINSTSKYINGNSDAISGVITDSGNFNWDVEKYPGMKEYKKFGKFAYTAKLRNGLFRNTGACIAPQTAFYNLLGMETLGLRMERACSNAAKLAEYLDGIEGISVNYPGLPSSKWHNVADRILKNGYGAILTIRVGSKERAFSIMNALKIPMIVSNIGDTKTLIVHPESTLSAHSTEQEKQDACVFDDLIRVSLGIEDIEDLIEDFAAAIKAS
ncbi:MAG: PLP-dependent transferase [Clostridiales bacterium]|nr:PLP-dependent transferase [Clostridiales bacterium]